MIVSPLAVPRPRLLRLSLPLVALLLAGTVAEAAVGAETPRVGHLTVADGLPDDRVTSLAQTRDGFLWVGTPSGLGRFDGRAWRTYDRRRHPTLASDEISRLASDRAGYLWIGTVGGGLERFDSARFLPVSRPNQVGGAWTVQSLLQTPDSTLWVGTPEDLLYLQPGATAAFHGLPGVSAGSLHQDPWGHLWVGAGRPNRRHDGWQG